MVAWLCKRENMLALDNDPSAASDAQLTLRCEFRKRLRTQRKSNGATICLIGLPAELIGVDWAWKTIHKICRLRRQT